MLKLMSVLVLCAAHAASEPQKPAEWTGRGTVATGVEEKTLDGHRDLSLAFVTNAGRIEPRVRFYAQSAGAAFYFTPTEAVFALAKGDKGHRLRLTFPGANPAPLIVGRTPATGTVNELIGPAAHWRTGLAAYEEIMYQDLWPGIHLTFRGEHGALKYEFSLAPGANAADIRLSYSGADRLSLDASGNLRIHTALGVLRDLDVMSLVRDGTRATIFGNATINGGAATYRIDVNDEGESGGGRDTFRIVTSSGYAGGGVLARGNIQVK